MAAAEPGQRVLHVTPSFYPAHGYGGPIASLYALCLAQRAAGLDVRVLTSDAAGRGRRLPGLGGRWTAQFGVPTYYARRRLGEATVPGLVPQLVREIRNLGRRCGLVHVTGLWNSTSVLALALARLLRRPVVLSPRGALLPQALRQGRGRARKLQALRLLGPLLAGVAGWHVTSDEEAQALRALQAQGLLGAGAPIAVIPNGVRLPEPIAAGPSGRATGGPPRVLLLGRVHPVKNLELAIDALRALRQLCHPGEPGQAVDRLDAAELIIAGPGADTGDTGDTGGTGDGGYVAALRAQAERLGLGGAVRFPGLVIGDEKDALLRRADVLWLCSHLESFGNVVVEALAQGTPVVAVRATPWRLLEEEGVGRWVEPRPEALATATAELLLQRRGADGERLSARCRAVAAERFSWPVIAAAMRDFYGRVLEGTRARRAW